jgi:Flp pilus assembly protein TadB
VLWRPAPHLEKAHARPALGEKEGNVESAGPELAPRTAQAPTPSFEQLRSALGDARREAERERQRRVQAENELREAASELREVREAEPAVRIVAALPSESAAPRARHRRALVVLYGLAIAAAAAIFLVGFHSAYAAGVAALTAAALSLGVDSWLVVRRRFPAVRQRSRRPAREAVRRGP